MTNLNRIASDKFYLPGLNGLRAIAVLMVLITHLEGFKSKAGLPNFYNQHWLRTLGPQGVNIFFTLSGFLITLLLFKEVRLSGTINIKKFYIRRVLRIWPLFYLGIFLSFFVFPHVFSPNYFYTKVTPHFTSKLLLSVFFMPNLVLVKY